LAGVAAAKFTTDGLGVPLSATAAAATVLANRHSNEKPEVGKKYLGLTVEDIRPLSSGLLIVAQGSIVDFEGDAIVNAANETCLGGGGVDGAITQAGKTALAYARYQLPLNSEGIRCPTGSAKLTSADRNFGSLKVRNVIHAVGPDYRYTKIDDADDLLEGAYTESMTIAKENGFKTIAFPLISSSIFRGDTPLADVLGIAVKAVVDNAYEGLEDVFLVAFDTEKELNPLKMAVDRFFDTSAPPVTPVPRVAPAAPAAPVVTPATDTPATCSDKAVLATGTINGQASVVDGLVGKVRAELNKHIIIKQKVASMQRDLATLRRERDNIPPPRNEEERAQREIAEKAIESCSLGMDGMEQAVADLVATIKQLENQINEFGTSDYDITGMLDLP
jgi:O-acetyl-ADP-ribose deacetylase (regulator of RNase III)